MKIIKKILDETKKYKVFIAILSTILGAKIYNLSYDIISKIIDPILFFKIKKSENSLRKKIKYIIKIFMVFLLILLFNKIIDFYYN